MTSTVKTDKGHCAVWVVREVLSKETSTVKTVSTGGSTEFLLVNTFSFCV